jgi:hypothetical protein
MTNWPREACGCRADLLRSLIRANSRLFGWKACRRFGNIADDVDLDSDAGVTVALQIALTSILAWTLALGIECLFDMRFQGSDNSHVRKQHGSAIFGGINQHLDGKPPFLTITFWLRKLPDVGGGVSQGLRRRSLRKWDRLRERTIPGHIELPSWTPERSGAEGTRQNGQLAWVAFRRNRKHGDSTRSRDVSSIPARLFCPPRAPCAVQGAPRICEIKGADRRRLIDSEGGVEEQAFRQAAQIGAATPDGAWLQIDQF